MSKSPKKTVRRINNYQRNRATKEYCRKIASQLSEHMNSVQVVGTILHPDGTTSSFRCGSGDLLARMKASETWLGRAYNAMEIAEEEEDETP